MQFAKAFYNSWYVIYKIFVFLHEHYPDNYISLKNLLLSRNRNRPSKFQKGKNSTDGVPDPVPPIELPSLSLVPPVESCPPSDPKDMDIDDKQNSAPESQPPIVDFDKQIPPPDSHATIGDKQTSPRDSHLPNIGLDEHDKQIPPPTMDNQQNSPRDPQPSIQQNLSSKKNTSKAPEQTSQPSSAFSDNKYPDVTAGPVFS